MKGKNIPIFFGCIILLSTNIIYADTPSLTNETNINKILNNKLEIPEIEVSDDLPNVETSLRDKYNTVLGDLKLQGFEVNNFEGGLEKGFESNSQYLFSQKFPDVKVATKEEVSKVLDSFSNYFDEKYKISSPENLPSKEATLIWDKNKILNSATKPKGFEEAIKETQGLLKGEISESFKNEVNNKVSSIIEKTKSSVNDKPTKPTAPSVSTPNTPKTPTAPSTSTPNRPKGENPPMPELVIPKQEEIKLPI